MTLFFITLLILLVIGFFAKSKTALHSHWNTLLDNLTHSTTDFYDQLSAELSSQNIEGLSIERVNLDTGGVFSHKRLYLRVQWREYTYDCCCAPFGKGTFVSWWMYTRSAKAEEYIGKIPMIGSWLVKKFYPVTIYRMDTASMFMTYTQASVLKVIDAITKEKGTRLTQEERKPILTDPFKR